ncbi:unnamed protein product [Thlaspi arvense]|uniref:E2 ubiquitin-conjugating enzyme n=1 Tax=Thlaspi arvense TaxID=13288 RepID=A0AAU9S074_THLAR|nr:unnamed protein product [Thlaspi arvense]
MAQAARLSMRMQKEMKLLLSDPPHGASFPHLSSAASGSSDFSTFSTIDARRILISFFLFPKIEGPEDTVYANGVFNVKIQIPERYPFQPPIVAFDTPIYHPNIDNSGRICLDILNLPPKGAWQPSLNISTVLTSIGLLLSEPNPDDGLMCEVSREYKYNRQTFDYKAREMTEKYAKVKADDGSSTSLQAQQNANVVHVMSHEDEKASESGDSVLAGNHEKLTVNRDTAENDIQNSQILLSSTRDQQMDDNGKRKAASGFSEEVKSSRKKLSLALPLPQSQKKDLCGEELKNGVSDACKEYKKPHSYGKNQPLNNNLASSSFQTSAAKSDNNRLSRKLSLIPPQESQLNEELVQTQDESIVVQDSDESGEEEEKVASRSRLSLGRRRRGLKRRS